MCYSCRVAEMSGSQVIIRAAIGQLQRGGNFNRTALEAGATIGQPSPGGKMSYREARLLEAGVQWGMVSLQDIAILL